MGLQNVRWCLAVIGMLVSSALLASCGVWATDTDGELDLPDLSGDTIAVAAVWSGSEQKVFEKVMTRFEEATGARVTYTSTGDDIATVLDTKLEGESAPDVAFLPQPGLLNDYAREGNILPVSKQTVDAIDKNYADVWKRLGSFDGDVYGVWFDVSNKSTVWYNVAAFERASIDEPQDWQELIEAARKLRDAGVSVPISVAGADGWTLTDWFENLYIRVAGSDNYDKLSTHDLAWTDESVIKTLTLLGELFADAELIGPPPAALKLDYEGSVTNVFSQPASSGIVYEGSFVAGSIAEFTGATIGQDANWFPFPAVDDSPDMVVGGGDVAVQFNNEKATNVFMKYVASPRAASLMVSTGNFTSANSAMSVSAYPDSNSRGIGTAIVDAGNNFRFDMSDLAPAEFGATVGAGEWKILQDFLADPSDPERTARHLEQSAAKAFG